MESHTDETAAAPRRKIMRGKKMGLAAQMAIGLIAGVIAGLLTTKDAWIIADIYQPLGQLFITLVRMVVVPLVFTTLVAGAASVADIRKLGRVASKTLIYYFATTAVAACVGLIVADFLRPGSGFVLTPQGLEAPDVTPKPLAQVLMEIIPTNPFDAFAKGNMLQVIFFALIFGFAISTLKEKGRDLNAFFNACADAMLKVTSIVMIYAPIGVFGLMASTVSLHGIDVLKPLLKLILVMYFASIIHILVVYVPLVRGLAGISFFRFLKTLSTTLLIAFTTCSSAAALPSNMNSVRRLGATRTISSFSIPLGNTINMDGTAIYMGIAAIFVGEIYGIPLDFSQQVTIVIMGILASVGTMGVPGAGMIMISIVFLQVGLPLEGVALVGGVDRILDMARTSLNVMGDATGALVVTRLENELDSDPLTKEEEEERA